MIIRTARIAPLRLPDLSLTRMIAVARQRRALAALDAAALADIGLSRSDAQREAVRPFWDLEGTGCA